jgi:hypothetical protein
MRIIKKILLLIFIFTICGCSQGLLVLVKFLNIDNETQFLKLHFDFISNSDSSRAGYVAEIRIYSNDSLLVALEGKRDSFMVKSYTYPSIPNGFKITFPEGSTKLPELKKNQDYRFEFAGRDEIHAYGGWTYLNFFSTNDARWLFDKSGAYTDKVEAWYAKYNGEDVVFIHLKDEKLISDSSFYLVDELGKKINCEYKVGSNPTDKIALTMPYDFESGERLYLYISNKIIENPQNEYLKYLIVVPDYSSFRLFKYTDL